MHVEAVMRTPVYTISEHGTLGDAIRLTAEQGIGTLPVVDDAQQLVGVVVIDDIVHQVMPRIVDLVEQMDFVHDYGALENIHKSPEILTLPIKTLTQHRFYVKTSDSLLAALVIMMKHHVLDLPVVDEAKQVVGIVSHARIASSYLETWLHPTPPHKD